MSDPAPSFLVEQLAETLAGRRMKVVTAESCTGGGLAYRMTGVPGSSLWFERGYVTYSNDAKRENLGVADAVLQRYGAVSEEIAMAMAEGALDHSHADIAVAVTGIAGPEGGSADKPVGTVCFAWSRRDGETLTTRVHFQGDRAEVREQSIMMAIQGLLDLLGTTVDGES